MSADNSDSSFARTANLWVQTLAIVVAGLWGGYVFVFQEFTKPASAPINLSTEISIRPAGVNAPLSSNGAPLLAIELGVTVTNPSTRIVYLLSNYWVATGVRIGEQTDDRTWIETANAATEQRRPISGGEHYRLQSGSVVAMGSLAPDTQLKPNESVTRSYVFYVPEGAYDMIDVQSSLPSVSRAEAAQITWTLDAETGVVSPTVYLLEGTQRRQLPPEEFNNYSDRAPNLQMSESRRQLSLWSAASP